MNSLTFLKDPIFFRELQTLTRENGTLIDEATPEQTLFPLLYQYYPGTRAFENEDRIYAVLQKSLIFLREIREGMTEEEEEVLRFFIMTFNSKNIAGNLFVIERVFRKILELEPRIEPFHEEMTSLPRLFGREVSSIRETRDRDCFKEIYPFHKILGEQLLLGNIYSFYSLDTCYGNPFHISLAIKVTTQEVDTSLCSEVQLIDIGVLDSGDWDLLVRKASGLSENEPLDSLWVEEMFAKIFFPMDRALLRGERVLVFCNAGMSRSCTVILAYLMSRFKLSFEEAFLLVFSKKRSIAPHPGYIKGLKNFECLLQTFP